MADTYIRFIKTTFYLANCEMFVGNLPPNFRSKFLTEYDAEESIEFQFSTIYVSIVCFLSFNCRIKILIRKTIHIIENIKIHSSVDESDQIR